MQPSMKYHPEEENKLFVKNIMTNIQYYIK